MANKAISKEYLLAQLQNFENVIIEPKYGKSDELQAVQNAIAILNGDAGQAGSVAYSAAQTVAQIVAGAPADFDILKEISDWITSNPGDAGAMNSALVDVQNRVQAVEAKLGSIPGQSTATTIIGYIDEQVAEVVASGIAFESENIDFTNDFTFV
jgi:hypothetical protein